MSIAIIILFFVVTFGIASTVLWIWALIDVARNTAIDSGTKIVWVVAIVLLPFLGSIVYLVAGRTSRQRVA